MKYFEKHNWDVNLWILAQILAILFAFLFVSGMFLGAISLGLFISIAVFISVVAMIFRLNKIKKYRKWRIIILVITAIQLFYNYLVKGALGVYSVLIGG